MNDSTNVRIIADNIRKLEKMVKEAGSELPTPGAGDTGKIIKVGSSGYELATDYATSSYSETETFTGMTWIDGNDIYRKSFSYTTPETGTVTIGSIENLDTVLQMESIILANNGSFYYSAEISGITLKIAKSNGSFTAGAPSSSNFQNCSSIAWVLYTKTAPVPSTETKKKTTKKG